MTDSNLLLRPVFEISDCHQEHCLHAIIIQDEVLSINLNEYLIGFKNRMGISLITLSVLRDLKSDTSWSVNRFSLRNGMKFLENTCQYVWPSCVENRLFWQKSRVDFEWRWRNDAQPYFSAVWQKSWKLSSFQRAVRRFLSSECARSRVFLPPVQVAAGAALVRVHHSHTGYLLGQDISVDSRPSASEDVQACFSLQNHGGFRPYK